MEDKTKLSTEPYKGVRDFYPEDEAVQKYIFGVMRAFVEQCGYAEYHASILEPSELYRAKGVENEEIVRDQTYTFTDRGEREVTLRPEMTPTVARMVAARRRELPFPLRWYSIPNVFRYERPQRSRLREHWQLNVDLFGTESSAADVEIISMAHGLLSAFDAKESDFEIRLGSREAVNKLVEEHGLSAEKRRELLLLLDRRAKISESEYEEGLSALGLSEEHLTAERPPADVAAVLEPLRRMGLSNVMYDPGIVRGFEYYTGVVFEVYDTRPENNRSLFGGGRYDNLLDMFGEHVPAVGFGAGDVPMRDFLEVRGLLPDYASPTKVYLAVADKAQAYEAMALAGELRRAGVSAAVDFGDKKLGDQIRTADKHRIPFVIVVGPDELSSGTFTVRDLKTGSEEKRARAELKDFFLGR